MSLHRPPHDQHPISDAAALAALWGQVLGPASYRTRCVWLLFLDSRRRPAGPVLTVDDVPDGPYDLAVDDLVGLCREILDGPGGGGSVAMLMSRSGGAPWTVSDRAWARFLVRAASAVGGQVWPVRLAHRYGAAGAADLLEQHRDACVGAGPGPLPLTADQA